MIFYDACRKIEVKLVRLTNKEGKSPYKQLEHKSRCDNIIWAYNIKFEAVSL